MAHSNMCCCWALRLDLQLSSWTGISRDMNFSHWQFPIRTTRMETYVNVFRWDVLFVLHNLRYCFLFKCFKFMSMLKKSLFVSFVWQRYRERNECVRQTEAKLRTMTGRSHTCHVSCSRGMKKGWSEDFLHLNHLLDTEKPTPFSFSFSLHLFPSLYGCQTISSREGWTWTAAVELHCIWWHCLDPRPLSGQSRSPLRQRWNRLPALSALKCSLTSHTDCEKLI